MTIKGFKLFFCLTVLVSLFCFEAAADVTLSIYPTPVVAGEESTLIINSSEGKAEIADLPEVKNLEWQHSNVQSQNIMIINGKRYEKTSYPFIVKKPGKIILPAMTVTLPNDEKLSTAKKEILVSTGPLSDLESLLFTKCEFPAMKNEYYVGEDIPFKINVYKSVELNADPVEYPRLKINNVIFDTFNNPQVDKFAPYPYKTPKKVTIDGIDYIRTTFYTSFRALSSGSHEGVASLAFRIKTNSNRAGRRSTFSDSFFDDSFFSGSLFGGNSKYVTKIINSTIPKFNIKPLPAVPGNSNYLGLVGSWFIKYELKHEKLQEGEPITLKLNISGRGSTENISAPEISVPGFNTYPPEVVNDENKITGRKSITVDYVLIPTESGKTNLDIKFSIFDTKSGKYKTIDVKKKFNIEKGSGKGAGAAFLSNAPADKENSVKKDKAKKVSNSILYIAVKPGKTVEIPLYKNYLFVIVFLIICGPVLWLLSELLFFRKKYITGTDGFDRKNKAGKKKGRIIKKIKRTESVKELSEIVQQDVIPYINDVKNFPPGTTVSDLEAKLEKSWLIEPLKEAETSAYMPGMEGNTRELKNKILKVVKYFSIVLAVAVILSANLNSAVGSEKDNSPIQKFTKFYNNGKFDAALDICKKQIQMSAPNPNWIYNIGNCYFQKGDLAKSLVYYERAIRLEPRNSDFLENLNFVRRKLDLPEIYQTKTPLELILFMRDYLRPDEWMLIFAGAWFLIFLAFAIRRLTPMKVWVTIGSIGLFFCVISAIACTTEYASVYGSSKAVVVERNVKVFSLPTKESGDAGFKLNSGESLNIEETLPEWIRVRKGKAEGWIQHNNAEKIWPY